MHADLPVPAPANWPQQTFRPTDKPVLRNELWHGCRDIDRGTWQVVVFGNADTLDVVARGAYVVDDFGNLVAVDDGFSSANHEFWWSTFTIDEAACDWWDARMAEAAHWRREQQAQQRTRDLLRPQPVTVEIVTEPGHPLCVASIVVGRDPRTDAPLYSLHVDNESPLLISHAQLCALALAAGQLVKAATPRGRLQ